MERLTQAIRNVNALFTYDAWNASLEDVQQEIAKELELRVSASGVGRLENRVWVFVLDRHVEPITAIMDTVGFTTSDVVKRPSQFRGLRHLAFQWRERPSWCPIPQPRPAPSSSWDPKPLSAFGIFQETDLKKFDEAPAKWAEMTHAQREPFEIESRKRAGERSEE